MRQQRMDVEIPGELSNSMQLEKAKTLKAVHQPSPLLLLETKLLLTLIPQDTYLKDNVFECAVFQAAL